MLQAVLGLDAARIASAFLVAPAAMAQRLVRAKHKIRETRVRFEVPEPEEFPERLDEVLDAIYVAFGTGWDDLDGGRGLTDEALFLGRMIASLLPAEPECQGLLALMLHCEARRGAGRDVLGRFVPLAEQDPRRWSAPMVFEAERCLQRAAAATRFGRLQCEAAIQSVHAQRALTGGLRHDVLRTLYDLLLARAPSVGVSETSTTGGS
jgi:RNA polymerase sigma-70 factor (ECF subfamily)